MSEALKNGDSAPVGVLPSGGAKFTPGPWRLEIKRDYCDEYECYLEPLGLHVPEDLSDEDAHLIAAAPDLYAALQEIADDYADRFDLDSQSTNPGIKSSIQRARAALKRAQGDN